MCVCAFAVASQRRKGLPPTTTSAGSIRRRHGPEANSRHCPRSAHITGPSCLALRFAFCLDEWVLSRDSPRALSLDTDSWRDRGMTTRVLLGGLMHAAAVEVHEVAGVCFAQNKLRSIDDDRSHARRAARIPASVSPNLRWDRNAARFAALLAVVRRERFEDDAADQHCREHDQRGRKPPNHDQAAPGAGCQPLAPRRLPDRVCPQPRCEEERVAEVEEACFCFCTHSLRGFRFEIRGQGGRSGAPLCTDTSPEAWARAGGVCACYDELIRLLAGRGAGSLCWCVPRPPLPGAPRRARRRRALGARLRSCGLCLRGRVLSTAEGHRVMYDREVPFEIRNQTDPHDSAQEVFPASARPAPSAVLSW